MINPLSEKGFTLIELVLIIVLIAVIASIALRNMSTSVDTAQYEHTKQELDHLAYAIVGNVHVYSSGSRTDFGYVGDVGALPPNLTALYQNPGYVSWDGPYITNGTGNNDYLRDAWNTDYTYTGLLLRSTGSGANIDKEVAPSSASLFGNSLNGYIIDASGQTPGTIYKDSLIVRMRYPNGTGGYSNIASAVDNSGNFGFTSLPIGSHTLTVIYTPDSDTVTYNVAILPESSNKLSVVFPADLF